MAINTHELIWSINWLHVFLIQDKNFKNLLKLEKCAKTKNTKSQISGYHSSSINLRNVKKTEIGEWIKKL
jgi:hypothetical protein